MPSWLILRGDKTGIIQSQAGLQQVELLDGGKPAQHPAHHQQCIRISLCETKK